VGFKDIFKVFSERYKENKANNDIAIKEEVRNRIYLLFVDLAKGGRGNIFTNMGYSFDSNAFFEEIHNLFMLNLGKLQLSDEYYNNPVNDLLNFLPTCKGELFLDFLEYCFKTKEFMHVPKQAKTELVNHINYIFEKEECKFMLTPYSEYWNIDYNGDGKSIRSYSLESITYPYIILKEDEFINSNIIEPVLKLLSDEKFKNANDEFLEGLTHYKNKRYREAINSCCSALESTMKIICSIRKWEYNQNATGLPLIKNIIEKSNSQNWYEGVISPAMTIRNKLGAHGKGTENVTVKKSQAQLQINLVASYIVFLLEEYM